jgi:maspardin
MRRLGWIFLALVLFLGAVYLWPAPGQSFEQVYASAPAEKVAALQAFRANYPPSSLEVDGVNWEYLATGSGAQTILFLHGMTGSYDIWWQQIETLRDANRVVSVTYPAVDSLAELERGVLVILDHEGVTTFNVAGTSLGGYLAQYLVARHPERIQKAVFSNTFPPTDLYQEKYGTVGSLIPYVPEWLVMNILKGSFESSIYPTSGNDDFTLGFLNEMVSGRMRKAQVSGRYQCVVEQYELPAETRVPVLIIEASNDPLVDLELRQQLKASYPDAQIVTVDNGHFPYLATPELYTQELITFFNQ